MRRHPIYSSGGAHGSDLQLRTLLEPLFLKYGVDAVFAGHEHFYERIKPQKGIYYFTSGGAAKLREGDVSATELTAKKFDTGYHFMLLEIVKDTLNFQVISDQGQNRGLGRAAAVQRSGEEEARHGHAVVNTARRDASRRV
jgi:hypothetical protein